RHRTSCRSSRICQQHINHSHRHRSDRFISRSELFDDQLQQAYTISTALLSCLDRDVGHSVWHCMHGDPSKPTDFSAAAVLSAVNSIYMERLEGHLIQAAHYGDE